MNQAHQQAVETTVDATLATIGGKVTWTGAGTAVFGWATSSGFGVLVGAFGVVCGLLMQWYYNRRRDRREEAAERRAQAEHERRMAER